MTRIKLENLSKSFGENQVVKNLNIAVKPKELLTLLGPSGCGKTTTLRLILGSIFPDDGRIYFDDEDVTDIPCHKRNVGIVYQDYALFPHLTAYENVAFGLKVRKMPKQEIKWKIKKFFTLMQIEGLEQRYPKQLSGGQQQRVALARALIVEPRILLLDEPLSSLDANLRVNLRYELRNFQKLLGVTTVYVTHDQEEALLISNRVAIMKSGEILQIGEAKEFMDIIKEKIKNLTALIENV